MIWLEQSNSKYLSRKREMNIPIAMKLMKGNLDSENFNEIN